MATALLLTLSLRLSAQGGPPPAVTAHFTGQVGTIGTSFSHPTGVSVDAAGNVYVADASNNQIVKETLSGGTYTQSVLLTSDPAMNYWYRVVVDASGNLYIVDSAANQILKETLSSGTYNQSVIPTTVLDQPNGVAVDQAGDVYIADQGNNRILKETLSGSTYTESTVGTGLSSPGDVAVDDLGNVYIADTGNSRVLKETLSSGTYTQTAVGSGLSYAGGVSVGRDGTIYVAVGFDNSIVVERPSGGSYVQSVLRGGLSYPAQAVADSHGTVYIAGNNDGMVDRIRTEIDFGGQPVGSATPVTSLTFTIDTAGSIGAPSVVTQGATGLDFTDAGTGTCTTNSTSHSYAVGDTCTVDVTFNPKAPGRRQGAVVLKDTSNNAIATGYIYGTGVGPLAGFDAGLFTTLSITGLGVNPNFNKVVPDSGGNLYFAEKNNCQIIKYAIATSTTTVLAGTTCGTASPDGTLAAGSTIRSINALAINGRGDLFFDNQFQIRKIDAVSGLLSTIANTANTSGYSPDGTLGINAQFHRVFAMLVDGSNNLYISDDTHNLVRKLDAATGVLTTVAGSYNGGAQGFGGDGGPATSALMFGSLALALDSAGNLYTADDGNNIIRKIAAGTGIITTVAGVAPAPYSGGASPTNNGHDGDGGPATSAHIDDPEGIAVDAAGNLYVADSNSNVIRRVDVNTQIITTVTGFYTGGGALAPYTTDGHAANLTEMGYAQDVTVAPNGTMYVLDNDTSIVHKVSVSNPIVEFGSTAVGTPTAAIDVLLTNIGNAPLSVSAVTPSSNFNVQGAHTSCSSSTSLATAESCTLGIEFLPTTSGALTGTVVVADNGSGATQTVAVSGTAPPQVATQIVVSGLPTEQPFGVPLGSITAKIEDANGYVVGGSTAVVTVTVTGPGGYFQVVSGTAVNGVATVDLSGLPAFSTPGTYTTSTQSPGLTTATSTFTVLAAPTVSQPASLGSVNVGASTPGTHTFTFTLAAGGTIGAPSVVTQGIAGLDFTDAGTGTCTTNGASHVYAAGDTCTVDVLFNPKAPGLRSGAVVLTDSSNNTLATGYISGTGVGPLVAFNPPIIRTASGLVSGISPSLSSIVADAAGNLYITESSQCVIDKYTAATHTTAVYAGTSCNTPGGDGGPATSAVFNNPAALTLDGRGYLLVADQHSIRRIDPATGIIRTVAGNGSFGAPVEGAATSSPFESPYGLAADGAGNFYVADQQQSIVVKVTPAGALTFFAGTEVSGPAVASVAATSATLNTPTALTLDPAGNLYIADSGNYVVQRVDAGTGIISTVAGNGTMGSTGDGGPATMAELYYTNGLAIDLLGNLYLSDGEFSTVRVITADGKIHPFAGISNNYNGGYTGDGGPATSALLAYQNGIALDSAGTLYIADNGNHVIRAIGNPGVVPDFGSQTVNNSSAATNVSVLNVGNAPLNFTALTPSASFNLDGAGTTCSTTSAVPVGGSCVLGVEFVPTASGPLTGTITLTDNASVNASTTQTATTSGTGTPQTATQVALSGLPAEQPSGVPLGPVTAKIEDSNGNVVLGSTAVVTVTVTGPGGYSQVVTGTAVNGVATVNLSGLPAFTTPGAYTVATTSAGLTTATSTFTVLAPPAILQPTNLGSVNVGASMPGTHTLTFTLAAGGMISAPGVVTQGIAGLDFTDAGTGTCTTNGTSHVYAAGDTCTVDVLFNPKAPGLRNGAVVLTDSSGNTLATGYISGTGVGPLVAFNPAIIRTIPVTLSSSPGLYGIATDAAGNVFVADNNNCVINKYSAATQTTSIYAGTGSCSDPVAADGSLATSGRLYSFDLAIDGRGSLLVTSGVFVRSINPATGIITTIAGSGASGIPVAGTSTGSPFVITVGVATDAAGNVYVADENGHAVVKVTPAGMLSLVAGTGISGYTGDGGLASAALIGTPVALTLDPAGNLFIVDSLQNVVRRVDGVTGIISTVAGNGTYGFSGDGGLATAAEIAAPTGVAVDVLGNLYITDGDSCVIRVVTAADGKIHTFAGTFNAFNSGYSGDGGAATLAKLAYPNQIAIDSSGTLYIADTINHVIRTVGNPGAIPSFGSQTVNNPSAASDVSVLNIGNAPLIFSALAPSTNFNLNGADTTCTATGTVAAGASCVLGVEFVPSATGPLTGTITLTDNAGTGASTTQIVTASGSGTPQTATQIAIAGLPTTQASGTALGSIMAKIEDANGDVVLGSTATFTVTVTGPGGYSQTVTGTAVNGVATLDLSTLPAFTATGTYTVTATSPNLPTATSTFTVVAPATQVVVSAPPASIPLSGNLGSETATLEDGNGNVVANPAATITTTVTGPGGYTQTVTATTVNGVATLNLAGLPPFTTPGTYTETTTTSTGLPPVVSTVNVGSSSSQIVVSGLPTNVAFGGNLGTITATVENGGSVATSSTAVITATITGPGGFSQVVTGTAVNGVVSLNLSNLALTAPGTYTVTVTSPGLATSTSTITVAAATGGQPAQLAVTGLPTAVGQGSNLGHISASVETSTGSVVTTSTASVTMTITGPGGYSQTVTVAAVNGVAAFDLSSYTFTTLGTYTLTVASPGLPTATYTFTVAQDFTLAPASGSAPTQTVAPGAPATFALTLAPAGTTFTQPITLSATGLPPGASYSFNPPIVTPGAAAATSTLTITTAATAELHPLTTRGGLAGFTIAVLLLPFGSRRLRRSARRLSARGLVAMVLGLAALGTLGALSGCAKNGFYGHTAQTYVITVTATSGSFSHSTTVVLTEQ